MSVAASLAVLGASVALLLGVIALVRRVGSKWSAEVRRKAVHVAIGLYALTLPVLFDAKWPVVALLLVALAMMLWLRTPASRTAGLGATIHSVERQSAGDIWLALAIGFVFLRAGDDYILFGLPIAVIALSDAAAALTGSTYGRRRFVTDEGVKSWEGIVAFFMVTWIVAMVMLLLLTDVARLNVIVLSVVIAAFGAAVEAVSWRGLDNLFVPVAVHFFLMGFLNSDPVTLGLLAAGFFGAVLAVALLTPRLGLSLHASRALLIAVFFFLGVGGMYGAVVPLLVVVAHLWARRRAPCRSANGDLDFVATLCATGLVWLFVGESVGPTAINLYNLSMAGMLLGYLVIALRFEWWAAGLAAGLVLGLYLALIGVGTESARWVEGLPWIAGGSLALVASGLALRRGWALRWRAPRLAAAASAVPMAAYLAQGFAR